MDESKITLWEKRFKEQASSGMTVQAWCLEKQITRYTYYYWKQRIGQTDRDTMVKKASAPMFAKLEMPLTSKGREMAIGLTIKWQGFELILSDPNDILLATEFIREISRS